MNTKLNAFIIFTFVQMVLGYKNKLLRVDGISPTCFQNPKCREYGSFASVISVDKSLPYMGADNCCIVFNIMNDENDELIHSKAFNPNDYAYMAQVLNTTVLIGNDFIQFYDGELFARNIVRNITSRDRDPYREIYFKQKKIIVEFYKDRDYRSIFEISVNVYHKANSPLCSKEDYFRCLSNTSMCIHRDLSCDRYQHCPQGQEEDDNCNMHYVSFEYDKFSVSIAVISMACIISLTMVLICMLCFLRNNKKLSQTFISLFGYKDDNQNSDMLGRRYSYPNAHLIKQKLLAEKC